MPENAGMPQELCLAVLFAEEAAMAVEARAWQDQLELDRREYTRMQQEMEHLKAHGATKASMKQATVRIAFWDLASTSNLSAVAVNHLTFDLICSPNH